MSFFEAPSARSLRRSRVYKRIGRWAYSLGLASGVTYSMVGGESWTTIRWGGKPLYVLGWPTGKWRCVLGLHGRPHWPFWENGQAVAFGEFCGRCCPWRCCGSIRSEHKPDCPEVQF